MMSSHPVSLGAFLWSPIASALAGVRPVSFRWYLFFKENQEKAKHLCGKYPPNLRYTQMKVGAPCCFVA